MLMKMRRKIKAQSTAEYAIFFGIIVAVALGMQKYLKRGMQGKVKSVTDLVGESGAGQDIAGAGSLKDEGQYIPYYVKESESTTDQDQKSKKTINFEDEGAIFKESNQNVTVNSRESETF